MTGVFSGGLIYEFTQEPADYGIVKVAANKKDVAILKEFDTLQTVMSKLPKKVSIPSDAKENDRPETCRDPSTYWNIGAPTDLPETLGATYIEKGVAVDGNVKWKRGKFLSTKNLKTSTVDKIVDSSGKEITNKKINFVDDVTEAPIPDGGHGVNTGGGIGKGGSNGTSGGNKTNKDSGAAGSVSVGLGSFVVVAVAGLMAVL